MTYYKNSDGNSNILKYQIGSDFIIVEFRDHKTYKYSYRSAGASNIEQMKTLAEQGFGLNSYINKYVRKMYEV